MQDVFRQDAPRTCKRGKRIAMAIVTLSFLAPGLNAQAQGYYYINGAPAPDDVAQLMAANGLPFGSYWLDTNGNWGMMGSTQPFGNIYATRNQPHRSLSERGLLYAPGELLR